MIVRYSPQARDDLDKIFQYLHERSPSGADNVMRAIYAAIQFLAERPLASQATERPGIRVKIVRRYRFKIFYALSEQAVDIIHVRHSARRPWEVGQSRRDSHT